jgi:hypothetical protein
MFWRELHLSESRGPLKYENPEIGTTNIAFIKYAAPTQPALGDVIFNPGGPGGSGFASVLTRIEDNRVQRVCSR